MCCAAAGAAACPLGHVTLRWSTLDRYYVVVCTVRSDADCGNKR